jgi:hypothetical protein
MYSVRLVANQAAEGGDRRLRWQHQADQVIEHAHEREHAHMPYMSRELLRMLLRLEKLLQIHLDQSAAEGHSAQLRWRRIERPADEEEHGRQHLQRGHIPHLLFPVHARSVCAMAWRTLAPARLLSPRWPQH